MKRIIGILVAISLLATCFFGCGNADSGTSNSDENTLNVVTTVFPIYDWVSNLTKGATGVELTMLLDNGVDLHSFQPSAQDLVTISTCDLFIYIGGESDKWVEDALKNATNEKMIALNLMDVLGDQKKEEELVEGMEDEEEEEGEEEGPEYDEHIWLSLKNAETLCAKITDALIQIDENNKSVYEEANETYVNALESLEAEYEEALIMDGAPVLVFGDRFPFLYLTSDYGIQYYAAFKGCSAESEASFETICFLAKKVDEYKLKSIMCLEGSDCSIAETILENTANKDAEILKLNSMQSETMTDVEEGANYLDIMKSNLEVLKKAVSL